MSRQDDAAFNEARRGTIRDRMVEREANLEEQKQHYQEAREIGDTDNASYWLDQIDELEQQQNTDAYRLAALNPPPQVDPRDRAQVEKYGADLHRPHWAFDSKYIPANERPTNGQVMGYAWQQAHQQGINAQDAVDVVAGEATGLPSPDEIIQTINETSRFCRDDKHKLTGRQYNQGVRRLAEAKARGDYRDGQS
jgi:hypothetical protein